MTAMQDDMIAELQRTVAELQRERDTALEQQTATTEILRVISVSATDIQPVFEAIVERAIRLCEAEFTAVARFNDGLLHLVATNNLSIDEAAAFRSLFPPLPPPRLCHGAGVVERRPVNVEDVVSDPDYDRRTLEVLQSATGYRSFLAVPIMREGEAIGVIGCARRGVRAFTAAQIELLNIFADQAVIAIENARLITEQQEALKQQTATAEVLQVINVSPGNLTPVFQTMLDRTLLLCGASFGEVGTCDGDIFTTLAVSGMPAAFSQLRVNVPQRLERGTSSWRLRHGENSVHITDLMDTEEIPRRRSLAPSAGGRRRCAGAVGGGVAQG